MILYTPVNLDGIKKHAFDPYLNVGQVLRIQHLLIRMEEIKKIENLRDENFQFLKNPINIEIKMEIS